jgi:hypothetical protein
VYLPLIRRDPPTWTTIVQENFEGSFPNSLWQVSDPGYDDYFWAKRNCRAYAGGYSAWAMGGGEIGAGFPCGAEYIDYAFSWMIYGPFSLSGATAADFSYQLWLNSEGGYDYACSLASVDGDFFNGSCLSGLIGGWTSWSLNLANVPNMGSLLGQGNVWIAVLFESDGSEHFAEGAHVDNILVRKCPTGGSCPSVASAQSGPPGSQLVETTVTRRLEPAALPDGGRD